MKNIGCIFLFLIWWYGGMAQTPQSVSTSRLAFLLGQQSFDEDGTAVLQSAAGRFPALADVVTLASNRQKDPALRVTLQAIDQLAAWRKSHLTTENDRLDYAETLYWYGYILSELSDTEECLKRFTAAETVISALGKSDRKYWLSLALEASKLAVIEKPTQRDRVSFYDICRKMLEYYKGSPVIDTPVKLDLALTICQMAAYNDVDAQYAATLLSRLVDRAAMELRLPAESVMRLSCAHLRGWWMCVNGNPDEALAHYTALLPQAQALLGYSHEANVYNRLAEVSDNMGRKEQAAQYYRQAYRQIRLARQRITPDVNYILEGYISVLLAMNSEEEAGQVVSDLLQEIEKTEGKMSEAYLNEIYLRIAVLKKKGDSAGIGALLEWGVDAGRKVFTDAAKRASYLHSLGMQYYNLRQNDRAEALLREEVDLLKNIPQCAVRLGEVFYCLGQICEDSLKKDAAKRYYQAAASLFRQEEETTDYVNAMYSWLVALSIDRQHEEVIDKVDQLMSYLSEREQPRYASVYAAASLRLIACATLGRGAKEKACRKEYLKLLEKADNDYSKGIARFHYANYLYLKNTDDMREAVTYAEQAETLLADYQGDDLGNYRNALNLCVSLHGNLNQYDKQRVYLQKLEQSYEQSFNYYGDSPVEYIRSMMEMVRYAFSTLNLDLGLQYLMKATVVLNESPLIASYPETEKIRLAMSVLAVLGDMLVYAENQLSQWKPFLTDGQKKLLADFNQMFLNAVAEFDDGLLAADNALNGSTANSETIEFLFSVGGYYEVKKDYAKALNIYRKIHDYYKSYPGLTYSSALTAMARTYLNLNDYQRAGFYARYALDMNRKIAGANRLSDNGLYQLLVTLSDKSGETADAAKFAMKRFELIKECVTPLFGNMTEGERTGLAEAYHLCGCDMNKLLRRAFRDRQRGDGGTDRTAATVNSLLEKTYDAALFYKGLLLRSSTRIRNSIYESGNEELIERYNRLSALKKQSMNSAPGDTVAINLKGRIDREESELINLSAEYRQNIEKQNVTWRQVRDRLRVDEAAIEFITAPDSAHQQPHYGALILRPDYQLPLYVDLFGQTQLDSLLALRRGSTEVNRVANFYSTSKVGLGQQAYQLIFAPIAPHLEGVRTIYYSPTQSIHSIAMAALCDERKQLLGDLFDLRLVSSTGNIVYREETAVSACQDISLYGGIVYNADDTAAQAGNAAEWPYLKHSLTEVQAIDSLFLQSKAGKHGYCKGLQASEEQLRLYAEHQTDILHIATHGYYFQEGNDRSASLLKTEYEQFLTQFPERKDNAMYRAGLLFAEGNEVWTGRKKKDPQVDGIVMAAEIAEMNLSRTPLVVLSACETGAGFNNNNEGVFGLQRAFKLAGVESIVMSLWEVNDASGKEFMNLFYFYLLQGMEKHAAFRKSQQELRKKYVQANHWAAFVMMD